MWLGKLRHINGYPDFRFSTKWCSVFRFVRNSFPVFPNFGQHPDPEKYTSIIRCPDMNVAWSEFPYSYFLSSVVWCRQSRPHSGLSFCITRGSLIFPTGLCYLIRVSICVSVSMTGYVGTMSICIFCLCVRVCSLWLISSVYASDGFFLP